MRTWLLFAGVGLGLACSKEAIPAEEEPAASDSEVAELDFGDDEGQGKYYTLPKHLRSEVQDTRAGTLESIGYAAEGDEATEFSGILIHDAERCSPGPRLYCSGHGPIAILMSPAGEVLHEWKHSSRRTFPEAAWRPGSTFIRRAEMFENGDLCALYHNTGIVRLDRDSNLLWSFAGQIHHDIDFDPEGNVWTLDRELGLCPWIHEERPILNDFIVCLAPDGELLERISMLELIENSPIKEQLASHILADFAADIEREKQILKDNREAFEASPEKRDALDLAGNVFHTNTLQWLDGSVNDGQAPFERGHLLICWRDLGQVLVVDPKQRAITWVMPGELRPGHHEPQLLESGEILLFDNLGPKHREGVKGHSEVMKIDPATGAVTWTYRAKRRGDFLSPIAGTSQPLANGNVLVTSSTAGRAFEVTPEGDVVWDFLSPHRAGDQQEMVAFLPHMHVVDASWLGEEDED